MFWGNRVGKTEWGGQEVARYALIEHPHRHILPPIEIWCACPSYDQQKETTQKKLEKYIPPHRIVDVTYIKKNTWGEIRLDNGSKISFKSYEQGREKFQGTGKRLIWFDEEPPKDIWEECFVRSEAGIPLDIIMTMTPINGMTWVYDDIYLDTNNPDLYISEADWDDNPWLLSTQKVQMARGLSPQAVEVRKRGKFIKKVGMIAPWWQRSVHVSDVAFNRDWAVTGSMDFGFSNPTCFQLWGVDYDDNLHLFDGFYERQLTNKQKAYKIRDICKPYGIKLNDLVIVSDSAQAQDIQELNEISAEDSSLGFSVVPVKKVSGTNLENWDEYRANKMQQYGEITEDGKTKIRVSSKLMTYDEKAGHDINWFVKEIENLKWSEVASPSVSEKQQGARWDERYPNHAIDAFTYFLVYHLDAPQAPGAPRPGEGKIPGTFIPPSIQAEEENVWSIDQSGGDEWDE